MNLFNPPGARALNRNYVALSRKLALVFQVLHRNPLQVINYSSDEINFFVDFGDAAVVTQEMIFVAYY